MVAELTPGTKAAGLLPDGGRIPVSQTLPGRQPRRDPRRARRRHARLPDAAAQRRRRRALKGNGRELRKTIRRIEPTAQATRARSTRRWPSAAANIKRAVHNFSLMTEELGDKDDTARQLRRQTPTRSSPASPARTRRSARDAARAAVLAAGHADRRSARSKALADELGPTLAGAAPGRPRARPDLAPAAAVPAHHDADHPRRAAPVRARRRCRPSRSCARRCATSPRSRRT